MFVLPSSERIITQWTIHHNTTLQYYRSSSIAWKFPSSFWIAKSEFSVTQSFMRMYRHQNRYIPAQKRWYGLSMDKLPNIAFDTNIFPQSFQSKFLGCVSVSQIGQWLGPCVWFLYANPLLPFTPNFNTRRLNSRRSLSALGLTHCFSTSPIQKGGACKGEQDGGGVRLLSLSSLLYLGLSRFPTKIG